MTKRKQIPKYHWVISVVGHSETHVIMNGTGESYKKVIKEMQKALDVACQEYNNVVLAFSAL